MTIDRSLTGNLFGDWVVAEIVFLFLLIPLLLIMGAWGWLMFTVLVVFFLSLNWSKRKYKCKNCGFKLTVTKTKNENI